MALSYHLCILIFELILMDFFLLSVASLCNLQGGEIDNNLLISNRPSFCSAWPIHAGKLWAWADWLSGPHASLLFNFKWSYSSPPHTPQTFIISFSSHIFTSWYNQYTVGTQHWCSSNTTEMLQRRGVAYVQSIWYS